jgi:hypothetical protein
MARYAGGKGLVLLSTTASGVAITAVSLSQWTLDRSTDKVEVTAFGDLNKTFVQGLPNIQGTLTGFFDSADDALFDGADSTDGVKLYLYPSSLATTIYHYGTAWLDASISVDVKGACTVTGSFVAAGSWGRKP